MNCLIYLNVRANDFIFRLFNVSLSFRAQSAKKCLRFAILNFSEKLQKSFKIGLIKRIWSSYTKIAPIEKIFRKKTFADTFLLLCVTLPTVKIWGQSDKFPMSLSVLQCPLQVKKLIRESSAKYVNI